MRFAGIRDVHRNCWHYSALNYGARDWSICFFNLVWVVFFFFFDKNMLNDSSGVGWRLVTHFSFYKLSSTTNAEISMFNLLPFATLQEKWLIHTNDDCLHDRDNVSKIITFILTFFNSSSKHCSFEFEVCYNKQWIQNMMRLYQRF